ncbi:TlyA family RNA methyltransferase [Leucobacter insecticola]|uniref:TlyA family RNA methyltransferase n=1 Tax=Leucobacter insecticola TaxID=2714934 RepID=A0A6G8FLS2_9MICO|nr:TlyA family RNA methyltransferase [Leucobacter insecticola]QIM17337.1 TlyA family RNA methyltransferase [Leucobacter insecticola]
MLPELGLARSRSQAAELIHAGHVQLDGAVAPKAGVKVGTGSRIAVTLSDHYVGRAAHKLFAALDAFEVDPAQQQALDLGASTGGFTQVLLERGASLVQAIDVGHGQLAAELRDDPRVRLVEGCNARDLTAEGLAADTGIATPPSLVVADLSFISLSLILPAIARVAAPDASVILLIKPQFEVGRVRDGVVTDPRLHAEALRIVVRSAAEHGFVARALTPSPVVGGQGNREFLGHFTRGQVADPAEWEDRIETLAAPRSVPVDS